MAAATQPDGFLTLPAELQVKVYKYVLAAAPKAPGPGNLAPYAGLLLSCKKVAFDFEYEWAKHYNARPTYRREHLLSPIACQTVCACGASSYLSHTAAAGPGPIHLRSTGTTRLHGNDAVLHSEATLPSPQSYSRSISLHRSSTSTPGPAVRSRIKRSLLSG